MCAEVCALNSVENNSFVVGVISDLIRALRLWQSALPEPTGGRESSLGIRGTREDEYYARTQALVGGPAEPVQCGEKRSWTDTGEGPEWCPVHQFFHYPVLRWPSGAHRIRGQQRNLGKENWLSAVRHWLRGGPGKCLEIPLLVL